MPTVVQLRKQLEHLPDATPIAYQYWLPEDVIQRDKDAHPDATEPLTLDVIKAALQRVHENCNYDSDEDIYVIVEENA